MGEGGSGGEATGLLGSGGGVGAVGGGSGGAVTVGLGAAASSGLGGGTAGSAADANGAVRMSARQGPKDRRNDLFMRRAYRAQLVGARGMNDCHVTTRQVLIFQRKLFRRGGYRGVRRRWRMRAGLGRAGFAYQAQKMHDAEHHDDGLGA